MSETTFLVLAAGRGSRMRKLTSKNPKCLVNFRGRTLLQWQVRASHLAGISDVHMISGYLYEELPSDIPQTYNPDWAATNSAYSLFCFEPKQYSSTIVSYSDILYPHEAVASLIDSESISVLYDKNWYALWSRRFEDVTSDAESFRLNDLCHITEIGSKGEEVVRIQGQFMGLLHLDYSGWTTLRDVFLSLDHTVRNTIDMTALLAHAISLGITVYGVPYAGPWGEVDSPEDLMLYATDHAFHDLRTSMENMRHA